MNSQNKHILYTFVYPQTIWLELIVKVEQNSFHSDLIVLCMKNNSMVYISINKIQNEMNFSIFIRDSKGFVESTCLFV